MKIGDRQIGTGHGVYIIAELGVNHDGSPARAMELVDHAHKAGVDAIKLQYFETDRLMSKSAKLAAYQKAAGETDPIAMLRRLELRIEDMGPVVERAHALGMHAIVTVFSTELVDLAEGLPWDAYKTASPDIVHKPLLERLARTGKPLIVSTGASTIEEVVRAVGWLDSAKERLAIMQCVSCYPTPETRAEIGGVGAIAAVFDGPVGYSDHTRDNGTGGFAVAWGATVLEKHLTYDRRAPGPDHAASLTESMMSKYVHAARESLTAWERRESLRDPKVLDAAQEIVDREPKGTAARERAIRTLINAKQVGPFFEPTMVKRVLDIEQDVRTVSRQSIVAIRSLPVGHTIAADDLTVKRPGSGFLAFEMGLVVGRRVARAIEADTVVGREDVS